MFRFKALLLLLIFIPEENVWELRKNQDNILVYTRKVITSDFKEIKCLTRVHSTLSSIVKLLTDVDHYTDWIYNCNTATVVKKVNDAEIYSYQLFYVPWPADNRDIVSVVKVTQDKKTKIVTVLSDIVHGMMPEKKGVVRVKKFHSSYLLIPKDSGYVDINYEIGTDPGGIVPAWLVNMVIVKAPFNTQQMMNDLLQTPRYKTAKLNFIAEP
ncbi:MAG: START domain-containing protein [Bacteroidia bacterium]